MSIDVVMRVVIWAVPVLFSIVVHEVSHGWMAYRLGDDTAKRMGRLTLNPFPHIDPMGTVILPLIMIIMGGPVFGWAKPVPFNPYNFNRNVNIRNGTMWVALAGPGSNLILAFIFSFVFVAIHLFFSGLPSIIYFSISQLAQALIFINLVLASLNLIPIPPLDGSKILMRFLPPTYDRYFMMLERYGFFILIILLATGVFSRIILAPVKFFYGIFLLIPTYLFGLI
jgi:Zn-dependent protease